MQYNRMVFSIDLDVPNDSDEWNIDWMDKVWILSCRPKFSSSQMWYLGHDIKASKYRELVYQTILSRFRLPPEKYSLEDISNMNPKQLVELGRLEEFLALDLKVKFGRAIFEARDARDIDEGMKKETYGINALNIIQQIIRNDKNRMVGHNYQQRLMDDPCEQCGKQEVYCGYVDLGGHDFYDNSWHFCLSCLNAKHAEIFSSRQSGDANCRFCDYEW